MTKNRSWKNLEPRKINIHPLFFFLFPRPKKKHIFLGMDHSSNIINKIEGKKSEHFSILERFPRTRTICRRSRIFTMLARFFNVPPPLHPLLFYIFPRTNLITAPPPPPRILACSQRALIKFTGGLHENLSFCRFHVCWKRSTHESVYISLSFSRTFNTVNRSLERKDIKDNEKRRHSSS